MSQETQITEQDLLQAQKSGFLNALAASNMDDAEIQKRASEYDKQVSIRMSHAQGIREAVLSSSNS